MTLKLEETLSKGLSPYSIKFLLMYKIRTAEELIALYTNLGLYEILKLKNCGPKVSRELKHKLDELHLDVSFEKFLKDFEKSSYADYILKEARKRGEQISLLPTAKAIYNRAYE